MRRRKENRLPAGRLLGSRPAPALRRRDTRSTFRADAVLILCGPGRCSSRGWRNASAQSAAQFRYFSVDFFQLLLITQQRRLENSRVVFFSHDPCLHGGA